LYQKSEKFDPCSPIRTVSSGIHHENKERGGGGTTNNKKKWWWPVVKREEEGGGGGRGLEHDELFDMRFLFFFLQNRKRQYGRNNQKQRKIPTNQHHINQKAFFIV